LYSCFACQVWAREKWISGFLNLGIGGLWRDGLRSLGIEGFWDLGIKGFGRVNHRPGNPSIIPLLQYSTIPLFQVQARNSSLKNSF